MLYIGIDVAKRSHVAAAMGDGGVLSCKFPSRVLCRLFSLQGA